MHVEGRKAKRSNTTHAEVYSNATHVPSSGQAAAKLAAATARRDTTLTPPHDENERQSTDVHDGPDAGPATKSRVGENAKSHNANPKQTSNRQAAESGSRTVPHKANRRNGGVQTAGLDHDETRGTEAHQQEPSAADAKPVKRVRWGGEIMENTAREETHLSSLKSDILSRVAANKTNATRPNEEELRRGGVAPVCLAEELSEHEHVRALVSNSEALDTSMLRKEIAIGNTVATAHLDTCATHCFLSRKASAIAASRGYRAHKSKVRYSVEQGNPLCVTSTVHILPLSMIRNDNTVASWLSMLFIVSD